MKKLILLPVFVGLLLFGGIVFSDNKVSAATGAVVDRSTIKIGERIFFDSDIDDTFDYEEQDAEDGCPDTIRGFSNNNLEGTKTPSEATIVISSDGGAGSSACTDREEKITFGTSKTNFTKAFAWVDENTIKGSDGKLTFTRDGSTSTFVSNKKSTDNTTGVACSDTITISSDNKSLSLVERKSLQSEDHDYDWYPFNPQDRKLNNSSQCWEAPKINSIAISGTPTDGSEGVSGSTSTGVQTAPSCESEGGSLSWIICPILFFVDGVIRGLDDIIQKLLIVPNDYVDEAKNPELRLAWSRIRNIAYVVLIPIMLVMVISTALGFEFISAYTVKKAMPRLIAAVLFMTLSYDICKFLIVLTNDVGTGIYGLITGAFGSPDVSIQSIFNPSGGDSLTTGSLLLGGGFIASAFVSIGIILSYAFVALVGLLMGFFLLAFRQILIIALMVLAPVAILAWIFPGNDKLWKLWWGSFSKLLLLFPLIMVLIASGKSFALLASSTNDDFVTTLLKLIAYIGPYFLIPATFKFAGGVFATVGSMSNDRTRGLFDRNKKYRQSDMSQNWERKAGRKIVSKRADWQKRLQSSNSRLARTGGKLVGGYNIQAAASAKQLAIGKELNDQIATGPDDEIRGLTVDKRAAKNAGVYSLDSDGHMSNGLMRTNKDSGLTEYKTLGGAWVNEGAVNAGQSRWGNDVYAQQAALSYEMRKAMTGEQAAGVSQRFSSLAKDQWGMTDTQAAGAWMGAGFENQGQHIEYKNTSWRGQLDGKKLASEVYQKKGSYPLSQMSAHTIDQLGVAHANAVVIGDTKTEHEIAAIAETFMARGGSGIMGMDPDGNPIQGQGGGGVMTNTPGAAAVAESVRKLAVQTGVYQAPSPNTNTSPGDWNIPPPEIPRQN